MRLSKGFTLIELMTAMAIFAILAALAGPSFVQLINQNNVSNAVNSFMADMRYARSESVRRGGIVIMCRSDAPEATIPACNTNSGPGGNGWVSGWIVFEDRNNDQLYTSGEPLLRVQGPVTSLNSAVESGSSTKFQFTPLGRLRSLNSATSIQFGSNPPITNSQQRVVCINQSGRARIVGDGTTSCTSSTDR